MYSHESTGWLVTATGTGSGKTLLTRGLARALRSLAGPGSATSVVALKPIETGCAPLALDAIALARACRDTRDPSLVDAPGFYRAAPPLSPYAVELSSAMPRLDVPSLVAAVNALRRPGRTLLVEGAGGLLVPLNRTHTFADFAQALGLPLILVAPNQLGVLSHVLTAYECARARSLDVSAIVLNSCAPNPDESTAHNAQILAERCTARICTLPFMQATDNDDALADAVRAAGILDAICATAATE